MADTIDLIVLRRRNGPLPGPVQRAIEDQRGPGLDIRVHNLVGVPGPDDPNRWATIARARNQARLLGTAPWLMFLDDDVVLGPSCVVELVAGLRGRPNHLALAADYLGDVDPSAPPDMVARHVAMGATLFRRAAFATVRFRWAPGRCECQCCCDDVRRAGFQIDYLRGAIARHDTGLRSCDSSHGASNPGIAHGPARPSRPTGRVLTAFNRMHANKFRRQFLSTFRAAGNSEEVHAVTYGLYPSQLSVLNELPGVVVHPFPDDGVFPSINRLRDFQTVIKDWPASSLVAYWDAGDVLFQDRIQGLWGLVLTEPDRLHVVAEPVVSGGTSHWVETITDPNARRRAQDLLVGRPSYNGGFAAGTVRAMLHYLSTANHLRHSSATMGTTGGDQIVMNLYCHGDPARYRALPDVWNHCLHKRPPGSVQIDREGRIVGRDGTSIIVVHGNASTLGHTDAFLA